jgi:hypothetical protein
MVVATFLLYSENERQQSVTDFWPCILETTWAVRQRYPIIALSAALLRKTSSNKIAMSEY